ncbi:hypothetical protein D3C71_2062550 [compost metagenome]
MVSPPDMSRSDAPRFCLENLSTWPIVRFASGPAFSAKALLHFRPSSARMRRAWVVTLSSCVISGLLRYSRRSAAS